MTWRDKATSGSLYVISLEVNINVFVVSSSSNSVDVCGDVRACVCVCVGSGELHPGTDSHSAPARRIGEVLLLFLCLHSCSQVFFLP